MRKVRLIVLKSQIENLVKELHEAGLIDIRKSAYEGLESGRPLASFDEISAELLKLRTILSIMEGAGGKAPAHEPKLIGGKSAFEESRKLQIGEKLKELNGRASGMAERLKALESEALLVENVLHFKNVDFSGLSSRTLDYRVGALPGAKLGKLREGLEGKNAQILYEPGFNTVLVMFERKSKEDVEILLSDLGFAEIELPAGMTTPMKAIDGIRKESDSVSASLAAVRKEMGEISKNHSQHVRTLLRSLEVEAERAEVASRFGSSKHVYVLEGWLLEDSLEDLHGMLGKHPEVMVQDVHYGHDEVPPTVLDNPRVAGPMEFITKNYSLPNYFELDPTMAYFIALPLLYGMIVGDVVYGLMSMGLAYLFMKKFQGSYIMSNVSKIWLYSAIPTILFGLVFDEWAGMTHFHLAELIGHWTGAELLHAPLYEGFHRMENVLALVGLSALAGLIHLALGFAFGAINEWHHSKKHAIAKLAWIGVEIGFLLALLPYMPSMIEGMPQLDPGLTQIGVVALVVSVVTLGATEGVIGVIEIPGLVGNILSYSRIAAIGIVGVVIAELLNEFIVPLPEHGLLAIVLFPVFLVLHVLNCFVAMFESLIQGGRLNIVEFRSKFLKGGGDAFIPFALYTKKL